MNNLKIAVPLCYKKKFQMSSFTIQIMNVFSLNKLCLSSISCNCPNN